MSKRRYITSYEEGFNDGLGIAWEILRKERKEEFDYDLRPLMTRIWECRISEHE